MSKRYFLDTSALLAFMEKEAGDERVKVILTQEEALTSWIALTELFYITCRKAGEQAAELRYTMLKTSGIKIIWQSNEALLINAAKIKAAYRLSFADALIAACAEQQNAILVHKDPEYEQLSKLLEMEPLPYK